MDEQYKAQEEIKDEQLSASGESSTSGQAVTEEEIIALPDSSAAESAPVSQASPEQNAQDLSLDLQSYNKGPGENISAVPSPSEEQNLHQDVAAAAPAGPGAKIFNAFSYAGLPLLILFSAAISFWCVWDPRDLWFSDEVTIADAFMNLKAGNWLALFMNGLPYPNKPPLYFWFMEALDCIPAVSTVMSMFLASAISHVLFIISVWCLARATGHDRRIAFASGLITLGCLCIDGLAGYVRMDLLFAAAIAFAMTCLYRGACKQSAPLWLTAGFLLLAASTLIKGPFGIALALCVSILFLCWLGRPARLNSRDGIPGFFLLLLIIAAWLAALYLSGHTDYVRSMLGEQLFEKIVHGGSHAKPWWFYAVAMALIWLPWTLLLLFVNWKKTVMGIPAAWKSRREQPGSSWLWLWLACGFAILSAAQGKLVIYALPLVPPLAVLCARALLNLSPNRSRCFYAVCATLLSLLGLALILADVYPLLREFASGMLPALPETADAWLNSIEGTLVSGSVLILVSIILLLFVRLSRPDGALLVTAIGLVIAAVPYTAITAHSVSSVLSPKSQAAAMEEMMRTGYSVASYKAYPGAYAWHLNALAGTKTGEKRLACTSLSTVEELTSWLSAHPKAVIAMPLESWNEWKDKPVNSSVIEKSVMVCKAYIVAAINAASETNGVSATPSLSENAGEGQGISLEPSNLEGNGSAEKALDEIRKNAGNASPEPELSQPQ